MRSCVLNQNLFNQGNEIFYFIPETEVKSKVVNERCVLLNSMIKA